MQLQLPMQMQPRQPSTPAAAAGGAAFGQFHADRQANGCGHPTPGGYGGLGGVSADGSVRGLGSGPGGLSQQMQQLRLNDR